MVAIEIDWDIRRQGRDWGKTEMWERWQLAPEKIELIHGKILGTDDDRIRMLGLLLEMLGTDLTVRLGNPNVWRESISNLPVS